MTTPTVALGEVLADIRPGFASGDNLAEGVFQIRMNNLSRGGEVLLDKRRRVSSQSKQISKSLLQPGDVLFNATNSPDLVGKTAIFLGCDEPAVFSNHFIRLRTREHELAARYLTRWLQREFQRGYFRAKCKQWVNQATFGQDRLVEMQIPLPPIEEQRRIAAVLDAAEALRAKRRHALAKLDSLAGAIFIDMFGDPVANSRGWPVDALSELGHLNRGVSKHRPRNDPVLLGGDWPLIQTGDVAASGGYITEFAATYSDLGLAQSKIWPAGTLCITIAANIAKTGILTFKACFPDSVVGFTAGFEGVDEYVRCFLSFLQPALEKQAPESAQKNINLKVLRELQVPIPPEALMAEFAERVGEVNVLSNRGLQHQASLDTMFAALQQRAFRGEL